MLTSTSRSRQQASSERRRRRAGLLAAIAYEGQRVPHAGISAVVNQSIKPLSDASPVPTVAILPFHYNCLKGDPNDLVLIGSVSVPLGSFDVQVEILRDNEFFYLRPADKRVFSGKLHPYDLGVEELVRDTLFYGSAVARALSVIAEHVGCDSTAYAVVCHDWEAATASLALANQPQHRIVVVLHNVYDGALPQQGVPSSMLQQVGIDSQFCWGPDELDSPTILERVMSLQTIERTVLAVSTQFASDIVKDVYLSEVLAPHLPEKLFGRLRGNDNGLFAPCRIPEDALAESLRGNHELLRNWKRDGKDEFFDALHEHDTTAAEPIWGDKEKFHENDSPESVWMVTGGRDDSRQRGHDVLAASVPGLLRQHPQLRFLFFVMPGDEGLEGLSYLQVLAQRHPGQVLVLPFRFAAGYLSALRAGTWAVLPSLYGPFESANEYYLLGGLPGIGRATGGIIQQIIPLRSANSYSRAVDHRVAAWHTTSTEPTGILYREPDELSTATGDWAAINAGDYELAIPNNRVESRQELPLFRAMVRHLSLAITDGIYVSENDEDLYFSMISGGVRYLQRTFSWGRNAEAIIDLLFD